MGGGFAPTGFLFSELTSVATRKEMHDSATRDDRHYGARVRVAFAAAVTAASLNGNGVSSWRCQGPAASV